VSAPTLFAFQDDISNLSGAHARERRVQAFYDEHANAAVHVRQLKWVIVAILLVVGIAAWADENNIPDAKDRIRARSAVENSRAAIHANSDVRNTDRTVTKFIDGPTGFVFVYTADGWKFVPRSAEGN
jgi:hypothetical protein